ncbi:MAG: hypothetical protein IJZ77_02960 [Bacilli bacterium]|nr:hypothetical protein [Bacilli bacterium]
MKGLNYLLVTNDIYEFPIIIADSLIELAKLSGYSHDAIRQALCRDSVLEGRYKVRVVDIREPKDKFNLCEYKEFCEGNGLPLGNFSSIKKFAEVCFEVAEGF